MKLIDILPENSVSAHLQSQDKNTVIRELAELIQKANPQISLDNLVQVLLEREELGSTGIGSGVAIPHGKLPHLDHILAAFGRSVKGIDFNSQDEKPAHLFFVLVAPENSAGIHLKALAKLSRILKNDDFRQALMKAKDSAEIYQVIAEEDERT